VPRVALTFDDGPGPWTEAILDIFSEHGARATFFLIGSLAADAPDLVRRMAADGHEIGNHTWSHPLLGRCEDAAVRQELERTNIVLADVVGSAPRRFRAPRYDVDERVESIARELGLVHTRGDVRPPDWDARCTAGFIAAFVLQQAEDGIVVGLHDGIAPDERAPQASRQPTLDAVATIVPRLLERELELVTASELLAEDDA
jgi:peptidoglycan-N-acetylglucosamine deacetylase